MAFSTFAYTKGVATIGDNDYCCVDFTGSFYVNKLPHIKLILSTAPADGSEWRGSNLSKSFNELFDSLRGLTPGDTLTVTYLTSFNPDINKAKPEGVVTDVEVTVFSGTFINWAPVWINGLLQVTVWAAHPLELLNKASPASDFIHGRGWPDYEQPMVSELQGDITSFSPGKYKGSDAITDLWKSVLKKMLVDRLTDTVHGQETNKAIIAYLNDDDMDLSELPLALNGDVDSAIAYCRSILYRGDITPWQALVQLAKEFHFCILPRPAGFSVAPILPTMGGTAPTQLLEADVYTRRIEHNNSGHNAEDSSILMQQASDYTGMFDSTTCAFIDSSMLADPIGGTSIVKPPAWISGLYAQPTRTASTLGLGEETLYVAGCKIVSSDETTEVTRNSLRNDLLDRELTTELAASNGYTKYADRTLIMRGPPGFDVSPGSTVRVEPAGYIRDPYTDEITEYYVGFIRSIILSLSLSVQAASTWILLTHVRTKQEQMVLETEKHPMYDQRWIRAPLIVVDKVTTAVEMS